MRPAQPGTQIQGLGHNLWLTSADIWGRLRGSVNHSHTLDKKSRSIMTKRNTLKRALAVVAAAVLPTLAATDAMAQAYPNKPIRLIVPFAPAGTTDIVARIVADQLGKELGQAVIVENRAGGGGSIGANEVAKAAPDGYIIGMATVSTMAVNPATNPKIPYNNFADFIPVVNIAATPNVLAVNPKVPAKDFKEFLALLKKEPGKHSFATSGTAGIGHMMGELFLVATGTDMVHVPYKGAGPAVIDVVAGQVPVLFDNLPSSKGQIDANVADATKGLRLLAIAAPKRLKQYPTIPTFAELGLNDVNDPAWYGLVVPAKTPKEIVDKIHAATVKAVNNPAVRAKLEEQGADPIANTPAQFAAQIKVEFDKMKALATKRNIKLD
jgi:tripartite-type tricarboxylate transporter receptor subunit TctC